LSRAEMESRRNSMAWVVQASLCRCRYDKVGVGKDRPDHEGAEVYKRSESVRRERIRKDKAVVVMKGVVVVEGEVYRSRQLWEDRW
jgi:hypothetical protein